MVTECIVGRWEIAGRGQAECHAAAERDERSLQEDSRILHTRFQFELFRESPSLLSFCPLSMNGMVLASKDMPVEPTMKQAI